MRPSVRSACPVAWPDGRANPEQHASRGPGAAFGCAWTRSSAPMATAPRARSSSIPGPSRSSPGTASGWRWSASGGTPPARCCSRSRPARSSRASRRRRRRAASWPRRSAWRRRRWEAGPRFYTAPGFCTELMHLYLATGLTEATAEADADELLEPTGCRWRTRWPAIDDGRIGDAKTIVGIGWLARRLGH